MTLAHETEANVSVEGVRLHATLVGAGTSVLILHGFTGSGESMAGVASELCGAHRTIRVDLVGHGRSEAPPDPKPYGMERCVDQLLSLSDALCDAPPHLLGYSMGGRAALCAAARAPDAFASLLLVGASAGLAQEGARQDRVRADEALANRIEGGGEGENESEDLEAFVDHWMSLPLFASQSRLGAEALARSREERLRNSPKALANSLRGMGTGAQTPVYQHLSHIRFPVCLIAGCEDAKFLGIARDLAAALPRAESHEIPEAGHAAHLENPSAFGHVARTFFDRVDRERAADVRACDAPTLPTSSGRVA